ncbi:MAG: hypothetical protein QHH06_10320 [Clostridiales bacterium]|jgi:hypothetical protein|nr:hypothetical protein [Eubacteriales bacterium]MDH7566860.1 hypothetical protein [Clostridiales bacterium]
MRNDLDVIKALVEFIKVHVASEYDSGAGKIGLEKPRSDGKTEVEFTLVKPAVYDGWIPPLNYLDEYGYAIPGILVMSDGGRDRDGESVVQIRLAFATYDLGTTILQGGKLTTKPDSKGYYDLLNLITLTRMKLADYNLISGTLSTNNDFEWGMYEEQKSPYWHGWMTFSCPIVSAKDLNNL